MNEDQRKAVTTTEGPLLLIAGPGSGKTMTLVNRIVHLLTEKHVEPERIIVSTFTRKASFELQSRLLARLKELGAEVPVQHMLIGTLHSIFLTLIEKYRHLTHLRRGFRLLDDFDQHYLVYRHLEQFLTIENVHYLTVKGDAYKLPTNAERSRRLIYWLNKVNEEMLDVQQLIDSGDFPIKALGLAYRMYESLLANENALDFGMIQTTLLKLFREHPDVLRQIRNSAPYIMIDEYQDTNTVQERLILMLAGEKGNLCVVGDDDQSIYRFRGATVQNLVKFEEHFEPGDCQIIKLTTNYRSHPRIINFYTKWIEQCDWSDGYGTSYRLAKSIKPHKADNGTTSRVIKLAGNGSVRQWHEEVYRFLCTLKEQSMISDWNQVAFLFRSVKNVNVKQLADYLENKGIPVFAPRTNAYFQREEVQLALGAFAVLFSPLVEEARMPVYIRQCAELLRRLVSDPLHRSFVAWVKEKRKQFSAQFSYASFLDLMYELLQFPLFSRYIVTEYTDSARESREVRNMAALTEWIVRFEAQPEQTDSSVKEKADRFFNFIAYVQEMGQDEYEDESDYAPSGSVSFFTFHQSKGLEFPIVIAGSLDSTPFAQVDWVEEAIRPHYARKPFEPLAETSEYDFYRLFYTAFSRAQELLVLTGNEQGADYRGRGKLPSDPIEPLYRRLYPWRDPQVRLNELNIEPIKPTELQMSYAYTTDIALYNSCPRQYLLHRKFGFQSAAGSNMLLGSLIHYTIEDIHHSLMEGTEVTDVMLRRWIAAHLRTLGGTDEGRSEMMRNAAFEQTKRYLQHIREQRVDIQSSELIVSSFIDGRLMGGKLDAVWKRNGRYDIVDFKTGKFPDSPEQLASYKNQLLLYAALWERETGNRADTLRLLFTAETQERMVVAFPRLEEELQAVRELIGETVRSIEERAFSVDYSEISACDHCHFQHFCKII